MKPLSLLVLVSLAWPDCAAADDATATVRFSNNDQLAGALDSLATDRMVWKSPALTQPTAFFLKNVLDVALPAASPASSADYEATLQLTNGDSVCGQLTAVTEQEVTVETWFAGRVIFKRVMVAAVKITAKAGYLYRGPISLDGWHQDSDKNPVWSYRRAAFVSQAAGHIAHDNLLPDEVAITFEVAWKGDSLGLKVLAFSNDSSIDDPASGYEISFQRGRISLRNCRGQTLLGTTHAPVLMENDRAHIEIRASLKSGKLCLLVNDRMIENWTDPDVAKGQFGHGLHFVAQNTTPMRISSIGVAPWDGLVEGLPEPQVGILHHLANPESTEETKPTAPAPPREGRMELANGDSLSGEVVAIAAGVMSVKTPLGELQVPVARLRSLALPKTALERCKRRNGDIRAWFADGSSIVFQLDGVKDSTLLGSSQNFGSATFQLAAFNRLEFNIHDPDLEDKRAVREW